MTPGLAASLRDLLDLVWLTLAIALALAVPVIGAAWWIIIRSDMRRRAFRRDRP